MYVCMYVIYIYIYIYIYSGVRQTTAAPAWTAVAEDQVCSHIIHEHTITTHYYHTYYKISKCVCIYIYIYIYTHILTL